jgi:hypothetical protein
MNIKTAALKTGASLGLSAALIALSATTQDASAQDAKPKIGERTGD